MPEENKKTTEEILDGIYGILKGGQAPAVIGKPIYEGDLEFCKMAGFSKLKDIFGQKVESEKSNEAALPLNFGSKKETGFMPDEVRRRLFALKKMISNVEIQSAMKYPGQHVTPDMMMQTPIYKEHLSAMLKAYNITDFSSWIPSVQSRFYFEEFELPFMLADEFDQQPMDGPTMDIPGTIGHLEGVEETDVATFGQQSNTQDGFSVTARNNVVHTQITEDLLQDSAPKIIDKIRKEVAMGTVRAYERAIINGDTTVLTSVRGDGHMDTDTRALALNATFLKAFDGLRRRAMSNDTVIGSGPAVVAYDHGGDTASKLMFEKLMNLGGKFVSEKDDLIWVVPSVIENAVVTGAIPELFTAFAFGGIASNVTGKCPPIFGIKPVTSQYVRDDLNATGVYASGENKTIVLLVKKSRFSNFIRQATRIWAAPALPSSDIMMMTAKTRHAFSGNKQTAKETSVFLAYNVLRA
jgi:hypothetical protein